MYLLRQHIHIKIGTVQRRLAQPRANVKVTVIFKLIYKFTVSARTSPVWGDAQFL